MMHGTIRPVLEPEEFELGWRDRLRGWFSEWKKPLLLIVLPTLIVAGYYYLIAADQYESEAHFSVSQGGAASAALSSGFGELVGLSAVSQSQVAADNVSDFLRSHDAVTRLATKLNLLAMFQRPEADVLSRLRSPAPTPELLLKYYRGHVRLHVDSDTGLVTMRVRTFRPADSLALAQSLLAVGEQRINAINARAYNDAVSSARIQLAEAEQEGAQIRQRMTSFRQSRGDIDPNSTGQAQLSLISDLKGQVVAAQARLQAMAGVIAQQSPQYQYQLRQLQVLRSNLAAQSQQLAGGASAIATNIGGFEDLRVRQEFAAKRYDVAAAGLAKAREEARRQQLYLIRVVEPNLPVKSLFPQRARIVLTVFLTLLIVYSIGWLIAAGVREHAA